MSIVKDIGDISDKFYNNFLLRDMAYIVSGLLIILTIILLGIKSVETDFILSITTESFSGIVEFAFIFLILSLSYYAGLMNQEFWVYTGVIRMYPGKNFINQEKDSVITSINAINSGKLTSESHKKLERIIVIKNSTAAFGSALLTVLILFLTQICTIIDTFDKHWTILVPFTIVLILTLIGAISSNRRKAQVQKEIKEASKLNH